MLSLLKKHKVLALLLLLAVLLILGLRADSVRGFFSSLLSPVQGVLWQAGTAVSGSEEFSELKEENLRLAQEVLSLEGVEEENARLRQALGVEAKEDFNLLFAEIVGKEVERDVLMVNKGEADGAKEGMPVITQSRVAVGVVGDVFERTSKILLLSLKDSALDVQVQGTGAIGVLKGQGRYKAQLTLIPREENLKKGGLILTSALGGSFPDNLLVGELQEVEKSDLAAFQGGPVELLFQAGKKNSLFIITSRP